MKDLERALLFAIVVVLNSLLFVHICYGHGADELAKKREVTEKCRKELNVPMSAIQGFFNSETVEGLKDHKCYVKCVMQHDNYKAMKADGTTDLKNIIQALSSMYKNADKNKLKQVVEKCQKEVKNISDSCEVSYYFADCILKAMKRFN